jgi:hypothetical protein
MPTLNTDPDDTRKQAYIFKCTSIGLMRQIDVKRAFIEKVVLEIMFIT